jgi:histidinol-phosphate phosphatase family protein
MLNWAVFLDRDGVIVRQIDHLSRPEDLELIPGAGEAIAKLNQAKIPVIVVSNQAGVAKGYLTIEDLQQIHTRLHEQLGEHSAHIDALYFCPHHPQATVNKYLMDCPCRKPGTGMLDKAKQDYNIDLSLSYLVGDATSDILAGKRAGCQTILVQTGFAGKDGRYEVKPDLVVADLAAAVNTILEKTGDKR